MKHDLKASADRLMEAAHDYFKAMSKHNLAGGCIWLTDEAGAMVIFTRGEYRQTLLRNIEEHRKGDMYNFGTGELETYP